MILWRPVGLNELALIFDSGMRAFPPRLPGQPIFYPVLNYEYAEQIARKWNTKEPEAAGYVTRIVVADQYVQRFEPHVVGSSKHVELWVPAEELGEFNSHIQGFIAVVAGFFGPEFRGFVPDKFGLKDQSAAQQFESLVGCLSYSPMDVWCETGANAKAVYLNYLFWLMGCTMGGRPLNESENKLIDFIQQRWSHAAFGFPLPGLTPNSV